MLKWLLTGPGPERKALGSVEVEHGYSIGYRTNGKVWFTVPEGGELKAAKVRGASLVSIAWYVDTGFF